MAKEYSTEELARRFIDHREIQNLMGKYALLVMICKDADLVKNFWVPAAENPVLAVNNGYYVGTDAISSYYSAIAENYAKKASAAKEVFPKQLGGKPAGELFGVGEDHPRPLTSPIIEIAEDEKSAKGLWQVMGVDNSLTEYGPLSTWCWGYAAADFLYEKKSWKIWHLCFFQELVTPCAQDWTKPFSLEKDPVFSGFSGSCLPEPTIKRNLYQAYSPKREYTAPPRIPEPYRTFRETFSYGPND